MIPPDKGSYSSDLLMRNIVKLALFTAAGPALMSGDSNEVVLQQFAIGHTGDAGVAVPVFAMQKLVRSIPSLLHPFSKNIAFISPV